jgi:hypothetical protein
MGKCDGHKCRIGEGRNTERYQRIIGGKVVLDIVWQIWWHTEGTKRVACFLDGRTFAGLLWKMTFQRVLLDWAVERNVRESHRWTLSAKGPRDMDRDGSIFLNASVSLPVGDRWYLEEMSYISMKPAAQLPPIANMQELYQRLV